MPKWANFFWKKCVVKFDFCVVVNFSEIFTVYSKILRQESRGTKNWQDICFYFNIFQHICFYFANFPHFFLIFDQNLIVCHLYSFIIRKEGGIFEKKIGSYLGKQRLPKIGREGVQWLLCKRAPHFIFNKRAPKSWKNSTSDRQLIWVNKFKNI